MYKNSRNEELKAQLIEILQKSINAEDDMHQLLTTELPALSKVRQSAIRYCSCGFPISYSLGYFYTATHDTAEEFKWIEEILTNEVDFHSYRMYLSCPKCNTMLAEIEH